MSAAVTRYSTFVHDNLFVSGTPTLRTKHGIEFRPAELRLRHEFGETPTAVRVSGPRCIPVEGVLDEVVQSYSFEQTNGFELAPQWLKNLVLKVALKR